MKKFLFIALLFSFNNISAQALIGTPTSLILVYNYPDNYFYLELKGADKRKTERDNVFIIDKKAIQVQTVKTDKFITDKATNLSSIDIMKKYINWESSYINETFNSNINSKFEVYKSEKGREIIYWTYDMPLEKQEKVKADTKVTTPTQKQVFVITLYKDYIVGINSPMFEAANLTEIKAYLMLNIDGLVESPSKIDVEELNKKINK